MDPETIVNAESEVVAIEPAVEEVTHVVTQEDLDANPGLENVLSVGDEVQLPVEEVVDETTPDTDSELVA